MSFVVAICIITATVLPAAGEVSGVPQDILSCVSNNAPSLMFQKDEVYFPATIDWYLAKDKTKAKILKKTDNSTVESSPTKDNIGNIGTDTYIKVEETDTVKKGMPKTDKAKWRAYTAVTKVTTTNSTDEWIVAQYNVFYAFNTTSDGVFNQHFGDWERVTLFFKKTSGSTDCTMKAVQTKTHEVWPNTAMYDNPNINMDNGKVKVYVAKKGHGTYWSTKEGILTRDKGDKLGGDGEVWKLASSPSSVEIAKYKEMKWTGGESLEIIPDTFKEDSWTKFDGKCGQSVEAGAGVIGNSPTINISTMPNTQPSLKSKAQRAQFDALMDLLNNRPVKNK